MNYETLDIIQKNLIHLIEKWKPSRQSNTQWVATLGLSGIATYFLCKTVIYRLYIHPLNRIPGPRVGWIPFMGNFFNIMNTDVDQSPFIRWKEQYGGIYSVHFAWNEPRLIVSDEKLLKQILTTQQYDFEKPPFVSKALRRVVGNGVLLAEGDVHSTQRKMLNPAFSVHAIRSMVPLMATPGYKLRDQWLKKMTESKSEYTEIEVSLGLSLATLDVIGLTAFGQDFKSVENYGTERLHKISKAYLQIFNDDSSWLQILQFVFPFIKYLPTRRLFNTVRSLRWLHEEAEALVEAGIERAKKEKASGTSDGPKDLLALMVDLIDEGTGKGFTKEGLREQCLTFLAAGHETTSNTLSWCLWLLAQHQDVQDRLREEVRVLFQDENSFDYETINSISYLDYVCRETLRFIPTVPRTSRVNRVPVTLGEYTIPKGTVIHITPISTHRSKEIWGEDADKFNPLRWEKPDHIGNAYQYMPFLAGARQCIGNKFAMLEMKVLLSILLHHIQFFEKPGFKVRKIQMVTTKPVPNMTLFAKPVVS
ncbi:hypothetical protein CU097_008680 [Rhizopus azygosporus]|uniref:Cytochrome P450-dit2 n=1 Tax=Rhizopus azygosporus TaxID=86630 RepID=A0A367K660_RHIAZ|nr:hypothetical protein CU097_008680 [Rhizopus azygosporus]